MKTMPPLLLLRYGVVFMCIGLLPGCTSIPDKPLPESWRVPGIGHEVLRKGLAISRSEAEQLSADIVVRLKRRWNMGDDYSFETLSHDREGLFVQVNEGSGCYRVQLKKITGKWRVWRLEPPFYEGLPK